MKCHQCWGSSLTVAFWYFNYMWWILIQVVELLFCYRMSTVIEPLWPALTLFLSSNHCEAMSRQFIRQAVTTYCMWSARAKATGGSCSVLTLWQWHHHEQTSSAHRNNHHSQKQPLFPAKPILQHIPKYFKLFYFGVTVNTKLLFVYIFFCICARFVSRVA